MQTSIRIVLLATTLMVAACANSTFDVENRNTPVHVWVTSPELAEAGGTVDVLIYVGPEKVVEGPIRFPQGVPTVALPAVYGRSGPTTISAVVRGSSASGRQRVTIDGESWVQIIIRGQSVVIRATDSPPNPWGQTRR